jgi:Tfp pilus assembly protein PilO
MNEEPIPASPRPIRTRRFTDFVSSRRSKMFGIAEIVALSVSCFILLLVLFSYLYFLLPARSRLQAAKTDRTQLQSNLQKSKNIVSHDQNVQQTRDKLADSLERFEKVGLVDAARGRMDLYEDLNRLIVKNALRNTSGPNYTGLEPSGTKTPGKTTNTKWQSVYPGIAVDVTVEGPYQNIRRFISEIENSKQFVIINQVELQRATQNNSAFDAGAETAAGSGSRASMVSLQLNMATYFQRAGDRQE